MNEAYTDDDVQACLDAASVGYTGLAQVHWRIAALPVVRATLNTMADQGRLLPAKQPGNSRYRLTYLVGPLVPGECRELRSGRFLVCCADCGHLLSEVADLDRLPQHPCVGGRSS